MIPNPPPGKTARPKRGVALVIVLATVALLTIFILMFLTSIATERETTRLHNDAAATDVLADSVVQMAVSQIRNATGWESPTGTQGLTWASQPGAIRTFDSDGEASTIYKLYSSDSMSVADTAADSWDPASDLPSGEFRSDDAANTAKDYSALWVDMNSPVADSSGAEVFPIIDPSAKAAGIAGFDFESDVVEGTSPDKLPMPVKWIYLLKNGDPSAATGNLDSVTMTKRMDATKVHGGLRDTITSRVAFWTDDESSKVNINTAAGGKYWDVPRAQSSQEERFAIAQPANKEFQRYPGHPATTSLKSVFPAANDMDIYNIVPRVTRGGSEGGTAIASEPIDPDGDRLYASVDELLYSVTSRTENPGITPTAIEQRRFFLSAHSRSPEVTLFGTPRIACWPIAKDHLSNSDLATPFDNLIAFCSTIGGNPYYFQREDSDSTTTDVSIARNQELLDYLTRLTGKSQPGFGGDFLSKFGADRDQILTGVFDYIRCANLNDGNLGSTKRFSDPLGTAGAGHAAPTVRGSGASATMGFGRTITISEMALGFICTAVADNPATPDVDESYGSNLVEAGRNSAVLPPGEKRIQAIFIPEFFAPMLGNPGINPDVKMTVEGLENLEVEVNGTIHPLGFASASTKTATYDLPFNSIQHSRFYGGTLWRYFGWEQISGTSRGRYPFIGDSVKIQASAETGTMEFRGGLVTVNLTSTKTGELIQSIKVRFPPGDFPIPKIVATPANSGEAKWWWGFGGGGPTRRLDLLATQSTFLRGGAIEDGNASFFRSDYDVVRSIVPRHGDFRIIAGTHVLDDSAGNLFIPHPDYEVTDFANYGNLAGSLSHAAWSESDLKYEERNYFENLDLFGSNRSRPDTYPGAPAEDRPERTGDFDAGLPKANYGAYLNKPDEGNTVGLIAGEIPYFTKNWKAEAPGPTFFTPNRIMPSPGMFGSLPTGIKRSIPGKGPGRPWETLLFRPQGIDFPALAATGDGSKTHPNHSATIPDHLLLDLFWMPVVQPYAISEPFSTAGKINLNYQIAPFNHIKRSTGLHALLEEEKVATIPDSAANQYGGQNSATNPVDFRLDVNIDETLSQFEERFSDRKIFRSASEICDIHIVPEDPASSDDTVERMPAYWATHRITSDNLRERVYTTLYPRMTTQSNVFTVHYRVQALKQVRPGRSGDDWYEWNEGRDLVLSEQRGSVTIERYIDPNEPGLPDFATDPTARVDEYYRYRVVDQKRFAP